MEKFAHCPCEHPILCCCKSEGTILCKIADFDLMDKAIATDSKFKTLNPSPGGSKGMIAPEVSYFTFFVSMYCMYAVILYWAVETMCFGKKII